MSASQRNKGAAGEREFFRALSLHLGETVTRNLSQTRDGGADGWAGRWRIEVKRQETLRLEDWWAQACAQAGADWPALAYRPNRRPWRVVVPLEYFLFPDGSVFWKTRHLGLKWTAELGLEAFASIVREGVKTGDLATLATDPLPDDGGATKNANLPLSCGESGT